MEALLTTLRGTASDASLPKLNVLGGKLKVLASGSYAGLKIQTGVSVTLRSLGTVSFDSQGSKERTFVGTGTLQYFSLVGTVGDTSDAEIVYPWGVQGAENLGIDIASCKYQTALTSLVVRGENLSFGDISELGGLVNLVEININNSMISGSVNELGAKMFANGRTSGTINIYASGNNYVKVNNAVFSQARLEFSATGFTATKVS